jgi:hypothetical protein
MANIIETLAALLPSKKRNPRQEVGRRICKASLTAVASREEIDKIKEHHAQITELHRLTNYVFTEEAAHKEYEALHARNVKETKTGGEIAVRTREDIVAEYAQKHKTANDAYADICCEMTAYSKPILARFIAATETFIAQREQAERDEADELGVEFIQSAVLMMARKMARDCKFQATLSVYYGSPEHLFPFLDFN